VLRKRLFCYILGVTGIFCFQWLCWKGKVVEFPPEKYDKAYVVDLKFTPKMRYGYVQGLHGAVLVKTENRITQLSSPEEVGIASTGQEGNKLESDIVPILDPEFESGSNEAAIGVREAMLTELDLVPVKTALEIMLYLGAFSIVFWGPRRIEKTNFLSPCTPFRRDLFAGCLCWAISIWVLTMPLLLLHYGPPLFSTWVGPGAMVYSTGIQPHSFGPGMTVSYRNLIEAILFFPTAFFMSTTETIPKWVQYYLLHVLFVPCFYAMQGGLFRALWLDRQRKREKV
jgi:hypothetical protein